jgi:hypothetical protein
MKQNEIFDNLSKSLEYETAIRKQPQTKVAETNDLMFATEVDADEMVNTTDLLQQSTWEDHMNFRPLMNKLISTTRK